MTGIGNSGELSAALNRTGVEFLITDLDLGCTFMDVAQTSWIKETVTRNHKNARRAYDTVVRLLVKLELDKTTYQILEAKLTDLKARLEAAGERF